MFIDILIKIDSQQLNLDYDKKVRLSVLDLSIIKILFGEMSNIPICLFHSGDDGFLGTSYER